MAVIGEVVKRVGRQERTSLAGRMAMLGQQAGRNELCWQAGRNGLPQARTMPLLSDVVKRVNEGWKEGSRGEGRAEARRSGDGGDGTIGG